MCPCACSPSALLRFEQKSDELGGSQKGCLLCCSLMRSTGGGCCQFEEGTKFRGRLELRDAIEVFECACERIREAPHRSGSEFLDIRVEIQIMDAASQMLGDIQLALDECSVDDQ